MVHRPAPDISAVQHPTSGTGGEHEPRPSVELRLERSRFSRLLARFGLGELTAPILRPAKPSAQRGPSS